MLTPVIQMRPLRLRKVSNLSKGILVIDALNQGLANYLIDCLFLTGLRAQNGFYIL